MRHQVAISTAIDEFLLRGLKMHLMSIREFAPGWMFFEEMHFVTREDLPCDDCVMFHNNWVMTASAKVYRMKDRQRLHVGLVHEIGRSEVRRFGSAVHRVQLQ